jgi:hypothetical protein
MGKTCAPDGCRSGRCRGEHLLQPARARIIEQDFAESSATALIPTATQLGCTASLFILLPPGGLLGQKCLVVRQFLVLAGALALAALAPSAPVLVLVSLLVGMYATVAQKIVSFAVDLAVPARRGAPLA